MSLEDVMGLFNPGRWLLYLAFAGALALGFVTFVHYEREIGREEVRAEYAKQAAKNDAKREGVSAPIAAAQEKRQIEVRAVTQTIVKEVPVYVKATDCPAPAGFRVLHDAAADGKVPDPAGLPDAAPAAAEDVARTVAENYGICHETAERLIGLQDWVRAQQKVQ